MRPILAITLAAAFPLMPHHAAAQQSARHTVELSAVGRYTENASHYVYPTNSTGYDDIVRQVFGGGLLGYRYALSPNFALEARAGYLFGRQPQTPQSGGEQILAHIGVRASVPLGRSRFSLYGRVAPGISSFSSGVRSQNFTLVTSSSGIFYFTSTPNYGRLTHFSLENAFGVAARLSPRTSLHAEIGNETMLAGDRRQTLPSESFTTVAEPAVVEDHTLFTAGVSRSFGRAFPSTHRPSPSGPTPANELLISYALQPTVSAYYPTRDLNLASGVALTGSHFLRSWLALDSSVLLLGSGGEQPTFQDGGKQLQFFAGVKLGIRRDRYGLFAKFRPGVVAFLGSYQNVAEIPPPTGPTDQWGGDLGGVLELYPARNLVLRFDLGETLIHYSAVSVLSGYGTSYAAAFGASAPQFLLGAGWRF